MTDIRSRLVSALEDELVARPGGLAFDPSHAESAHEALLRLADVLLALAGIAIVDAQMLTEIVVVARMFPDKPGHDIVSELLDAAAVQAQEEQP